MNAHQYRWLLDNRRALMAVTLQEPRQRRWYSRGRGDRGLRPPLATVLGRAAAQLRQRQAAEAAWERAAPAQWLADTEVLAVDGDTLVLAAHSSTVRFELQRCRASLERHIAGLLPGVRCLRVSVTGPGPARSFH